MSFGVKIVDLRLMGQRGIEPLQGRVLGCRRESHQRAAHECGNVLRLAAGSQLPVLNDLPVGPGASRILNIRF
jgi:hypothetical protein